MAFPEGSIRDFAGNFREKWELSLKYKPFSLLCKELFFCQAIWNYRNQVIFKGAQLDRHTLIERWRYEREALEVVRQRSNPRLAPSSPFLSFSSNICLVDCWNVKPVSSSNRMVEGIFVSHGSLELHWSFKIPSSWTSSSTHAVAIW